MTELIPAASALILHEHKVLLVRTTTTHEHWAFPGGKAERGESPEQTAIREVKEEVGLDIEVADELGKYVTPSGYKIACLVATAASHVLTTDPGEIIEARWVNLGEAFDLNLVSTVREALLRFSSGCD